MVILPLNCRALRENYSHHILKHYKTKVVKIVWYRHRNPCECSSTKARFANTNVSIFIVAPHATQTLLAQYLILHDHTPTTQDTGCSGLESGLPTFPNSPSNAPQGHGDNSDDYRNGHDSHP